MVSLVINSLSQGRTNYTAECGGNLRQGRQDIRPGTTRMSRMWAWTMLKPSDITQGLIKALVFGFAVTLIACRHGYFASGGAVGVGQATTKAVVWGVVGVFVLDYIITSMLTEI